MVLLNAAETCRKQFNFIILPTKHQLAYLMNLKPILPLAVTAILVACDTKTTINIDEIYNRLTPDERIAQLCGIHMADFFDKEGRLDTVKCREVIPYGIGHISQYAVSDRRSPEMFRDMVRELQTWLMTATPNGIPAVFHEEVLTGVATYDATVYPQQIGLACSFNPELACTKAEQTADDLRAIGGTLALSPMVDVVRNPSFNRLEESYGEDSYLGAAMGCAFVRGLQHGEKFGSEGIGATTKHFLGYGGGGDADIAELMEDIILPHEAIIRTAGSKALMTGYHLFRDNNAEGKPVKCVANGLLQQTILRDYIGFEGMTVSDYASIEQIDDSLSAVQRAAAAINAGNDVDFPDGTSYKYLKEAVEQGLVADSTLERAVKNVLRYKAEVGLLDNKPKFGDEGEIVLDGETERLTALELARQSVVLLENNGVLPLKATDGRKKVALVGPNANTMWAMLGDYTYHSMRFFWQSQVEDALHPRIVTLKEGLENRMGDDFELSYSRGCDWTEDVETVYEKGGDPRAAYMQSIQNRKVDAGEKADREAALKMAAESDVIIAAVGENVILCGENRDRCNLATGKLSLRLPGKQEDFVNDLIATGKPVVLVVFGGRAIVLGDLAKRCAAIIQAWYPGEEGGNALADILCGITNPSGKLSVSYPAEEIFEPFCYFSATKTTGGGGKSRIAWPFGYGLSYTTYKYGNIKIDKETATDGDGFDVSVDVENSGKMDGCEIVQLYASPAVEDAKCKLQGFKRVDLKVGEKRTVTFHVYPDQLGHYIEAKDANGNFLPGHWTVDPGKYIVKIGASSADIREESEITLIGNKFDTKLRRHYFAE